MTMTEATGSAARRGPADERQAAAPLRTAPVPQPPAVIDAGSLAQRRHGPVRPESAVAGRAAEAIFKAAVRRLPAARSATRTVPSWARPAAAGHTYPVMTMNRPEAFEARIGDGGLIGLGESFMAGDWDADDLTGVMEVFAARVDTLMPEPLQKLRAPLPAAAPRQERNTEQNTRCNISRHYDLSNELFATFLDTP